MPDPFKHSIFRNTSRLLTSFYSPPWKPTLTWWHHAGHLNRCRFWIIAERLPFVCWRSYLLGSTFSYFPKSTNVSFFSFLWLLAKKKSHSIRERLSSCREKKKRKKHFPTHCPKMAPLIIRQSDFQRRGKKRLPLFFLKFTNACAADDAMACWWWRKRWFRAWNRITLHERGRKSVAR